MRASKTRSSIAILAGLASILLAGAGRAQDGPGPATCTNLIQTVAPPAPAPWPSAAEQLARDGVRPDSELARLILANQDFDLLRPGEAADGNPLPPWLRVLWRKTHPRTPRAPLAPAASTAAAPTTAATAATAALAALAATDRLAPTAQGTPMSPTAPMAPTAPTAATAPTTPTAARDLAAAKDPAAAYPSILRQVHLWMIHHQDLKPGAPPASRAAQAVASDNGQRRISGAQTTPVNTSYDSVDPYAPNQILAAADDLVSFGRVLIFYSTDGGASWGESSLPFGPDDILQADGAVAWTSDGAAWATAVALTAVTETSASFQVRAYKSIDQGRTWTFDALISGSLDGDQLDALWADRGSSSPFKDNLYAMWNASDAVYFNRRTGPGGSWHTALQVSDAQILQSVAGPDVKTNGAGDVFGFWSDSPGYKIFFVKSTDGGVTFGTPAVISGVFSQGAVSTPAVFGFLVHVSGGAFKSATQNDVYATWNDLSGEAGCTEWNEQPSFTTAVTTCKTRVWFARSTDGGHTWSTPVKINDRRTVNDQFAPELAVDDATGQLGIVYYDTTTDPTRRTTNLFFQSSHDGGITWSDPFQVTTASTDETILGADESAYGEHIGISVANGVFVPVWTDRRNGGFEEVWSTSIADPAGCTGPAVTGLAAMPQAAGVNLTWDAVAGATYRVLRAAASGGPYSQIATTTFNSYFDAAGHCDLTSYYAVRAVTSCTSALSTEVSATARPTTVLYSNDFESGSGLSDWTAGALPGYGSAADWAGIQACPAHSGSRIFRFGGATCSTGAGPGDVAFAYPNGPLGIPVPAGATATRLSFWQRRDFSAGSGGVLGIGLSNRYSACLPIGSDAVGGDGYNGAISSTCAPMPMLGRAAFNGASSTFTNTTVDLDRACADFGTLVGCAGQDVEVLFMGVTDCGAPQLGWFLDDVTVTACLAPPPPTMGFYTVAPCRLVDTRQPAGPAGGPALAASGARTLTLAGRCGIPPTARALAVNISVVQPGATGWLTLYAGDVNLPPTSNISFAAGEVRANNAMLALGDGTGSVVAQNGSAGRVDLIIDVNGYFQ